MSSEPEILLRCRNICKSYEIYSSPYKRLLQTCCMGRRNFYRRFDALQGIDLELRRGECLGVIGRNGAGKSTLLSLLAGTLRPSSGTVEKNGRSCALLELGFGFNPDFTGRENIAVAGLMQGMSREEVRENADAVIRFADIGDFIDQPVKKYSSGMFVRLAFAVVAHVNAPIRLVDEALAVGDIFFQQKCYRLLEEQKKRSALVLVSHDLNAVSTLCDRVMVLDRGRAVFCGETREAIEFYTHLLYRKVAEAPRPAETPADLQPVPAERQTGESGRLTGAKLSRTVLHADDRLNITAQAELLKACPRPIVGFFFNDRFGKRIFGNCVRPPAPLAPGRVQFSFDLQWPDITPGEYTLTLGIGSGGDIMAQEVYCWATDFYVVTSVKERDIVHGIFNIPMENFICKGL